MRHKASAFVAPGNALRRPQHGSLTTFGRRETRWNVESQLRDRASEGRRQTVVISLQLDQVGARVLLRVDVLLGFIATLRLSVPHEDLQI